MLVRATSYCSIIDLRKQTSADKKGKADKRDGLVHPVDTDVCVSSSVWMCVYASVCVCVCVCVCARVCLHLCQSMYVCMRGRMCVW